MGGSYPLTRGKRVLEARLVHQPGLIPAHAGKTGSGSSDATRPGAHPRSRGENRVFCGTHAATAGSSPLTRGKRRGQRRGSGLRRLIPAHAGKTSSSTDSRRSTAAHPRSRGENCDTEHGGEALNGSSPLTRGKLGRAHGTRPRVRLIPAHAGKTVSALVSREVKPAHPRSRGENVFWLCQQ